MYMYACVMLAHVHVHACVHEKLHVQRYHNNNITIIILKSMCVTVVYVRVINPPGQPSLLYRPVQT